jgi:hypothetical protein
MNTFCDNPKEEAIAKKIVGILASENAKVGEISGILYCVRRIVSKQIREMIKTEEEKVVQVLE